MMLRRRRQGRPGESGRAGNPRPIGAGVVNLGARRQLTERARGALRATACLMCTGDDPVLLACPTRPSHLG